MKMKKRTIKQILPLIWPYGLLFLLVLVLFTTGSIVSYRTVIQNAEQTAQRRYKTLSDQVINWISSYRKACDVLAASNSVLTFGEIPETEEAAFQTAINTVRQDMTNVMGIVNFPYSDVEVYYPNQQVIVSLHREYRGQKACENRLTSQSGGDTLRSAMEKLEENSIWMVCDNAGKGWLVRKIVSRDEPLAYLIMEYQLSGLVPLEEGEGIVLIGQGDSLRYSSAKEITQAEFPAVRKEVQSSHHLQYNGEKYLAYRCIFSLMQTEITIGISVDRIVRNTPSMLNIQLTLTVICAACSFLLYRIMYKQVILPYHYLAEETWEDSGTERPQDVLTRAREKLLAMKTQQKASEEERRLLIPLGVGDLLQQIRTGPKEQRLEVARRCLSLAGVLPGKRYLVFAIVTPQEDSAQNLIEQAVQESLLIDRVGVVATVEHYLIVLASCLEGDTEPLLKDLIDQVSVRCQEEAGVSLAATRPLIGDAPEALRRIIRQTMNDVTYLYFWDKERIDEVSSQEKPEELIPFIKGMRNLINRLDNQDYAGAQQAFSRIIEKNLPRSAEEFQITKSRIYGMMEMLITAISEQEDCREQDLRNLDYERRLSGIDNLHVFYETAQKIFSELIEFRQRCDAAESGAQRIENIKAYIDDHYTENSLTVTSIADHFQLSGPYLSREFKRMAGCNLLEYIQKLRIEQVKRLLADHSVKDAALQTGFCDSQALVRVFKKYEGITPGEYKKSLQ